MVVVATSATTAGDMMPCSLLAGLLVEDTESWLPVILCHKRLHHRGESPAGQVRKVVKARWKRHMASG